MSRKNSNDTIGNRKRDFPACSALKTLEEEIISIYSGILKVKIMNCSFNTPVGANFLKSFKRNFEDSHENTL
jgi:hypothetical protein